MIDPLRTHRASAVRGLAFFLSACLVAPPTLLAEDVDVGMTVADQTAADLALDIADGKLELELEEAIAIALERNLAISVQRYLRSESLLDIDAALGMYDFNLAGFAQLSSEVSPPTTQLVQTGGAAQQTDSSFVRASLSRLFPSGGTAQLLFSNGRREDNDAFFTFNPAFSQNLDFSFNQPLLRGFGKTTTERNLIVARLSSSINRENFDLEVQRVVQDISTSYWRLVEAREQLSVAEESLRLAEELHDMNKIQVEVGTMAPLETVQSEAGVARARNTIISRRAAVQDREDELRRLLNLDQGEMWSVPIMPVTEAEVAHEDISVDASIEKALASRADIRRKRLEIENAALDAKVAKIDTRPQLDADATYGFNGIGGRRLDLNTGIIDPGGFSDALNQVLGGNFEGWAVSLTFGYPLRNTAAKARYAAAELAVDRANVELRDLELEAVTAVRRLVRAVETAAEQIESARVSSRLERKNLEAEQKRYENGLSTSFRVLQIQEDLAEARSAEVSAVVGYRQALVNLFQATGELLGVNGVRLVDGSEQP